MKQIHLDERLLAAVACALGARRVPGWSKAESNLVRDLPNAPAAVVHRFHAQIQVGADPLGDTFTTLRSPTRRRPSGATYTPQGVVDAMLAQTSGQDLARVVDPGVGSGRFLVGAGRLHSHARLVGIELDPLAALLARAHIAAAGLAHRTEIVLGDYRSWTPSPIDGRTLFIGNPPYVRHHLIDRTWKAWFVDSATRMGMPASQLAGLHLHFFLATAIHARQGDLGLFITAAEWLDVNYGSLLRKLLLGPLGGAAITLFEPTARIFPDAATTAALTAFTIGARPRSIRLHRVSSTATLKKDLRAGRRVKREVLEAATRWTPLTRAPKSVPRGYIQLGELFRVHRGQVTGSNRVWIEGEHSRGLPPTVLYPSVTRARELFLAKGILRPTEPLKRVIDIPVELSRLSKKDRASVEAFLRIARKMGASEGYVAENRRAWWAVGLREPAPILATYMARRPPAFVRNIAGARHINVAHGLYPREPMAGGILDFYASHLSRTVQLDSGRTYAGGLTKFEPREMERLFVPPPSVAAGKPPRHQT